MRSIGLDLDNTLIDYTPAFPHVARSLEIPCPATRRHLRDTLREHDDEGWQQFQSLLYTDGLEHAVPAAGSLDFLRAAREAHLDTHIVSHKTITTPDRFGARSLRQPALAWLMRHDIVPALVIDPNIHFCATRDEKVEVIRSAGFDWFVDDLREVLEHPGFPPATHGWWYHPERSVTDEAVGPEVRDADTDFPVSAEPVDFFELLRRLRAELGTC